MSVFPGVFMLAPILVFVLFALFAGGMIALIVFLVIRGSKAEEERQAALPGLAASYGMTFSPQDPFNLPGRLEPIAPFGSGHDRIATNVMYGSVRGRELILFDYKYTTTESTTDSKGHHHTREVDHHLSACLHALEYPFPGLVIRPEGFFDKVAGFFGFDDIDFESEEFSRRFCVKSADRKFAYDVCHPRMMEFLLASEGWEMEFTGGWWVLRCGGRWTPGQFRSAVEFTLKFFEMIPDFVWKEYRDQRAGA